MQDVRRLEIPAGYPYPDVIDVVSPNDTMLSGADFAHYLSVGNSALANVAEALRARANLYPQTILDMPCGHGRVTRVLKSAFPSSTLFVGDSDEDGLRFCAQTFGARPLASGPNFRTLDLGQRFDLIWAGSLITHLPGDVIGECFDFFLRHLTERGVAVVSSHGAYVAGMSVASLLQGRDAYGAEQSRGWRMVDDYFASGFGYAEYPNAALLPQRCGVSLATKDWICRSVKRCGGRVVFYREHAWDRHHDVVALARAEAMHG